MLMSNSTTATKVNIYVKFGNLKHVMEWCRENCIGYWFISNYTPDFFVDTNLSPDTYEFIFDNEMDAVSFSLQWK